MPVVSDETALLSGYYWSGIEVENKQVFVTYSFPTAATASHQAVLGSTAFATFQPLTVAEQNAARAALAEWSAASGITFLEVAPGNGEITFSGYNFGGSGSDGFGGYAEYPFGNWDYATASSTPGDYLFYDDAPFQRAGDILLNTAAPPGGTAGVDSYETILHEIGHALGFKHPTETFGTHTEVLASDDPNLTVMSTQGGGPGHLTDLDKAAAARIYGAAGSAGAQVASWSWNAATETLTQTGFETADEIRGTNVADIINGQGGDDKIFGLGGNDVLKGGAGNDRIFDAADYVGTTQIDGGIGNDRIALYKVNAGFTGTVAGGADADRLVAWGDLSGLTISGIETFVESYYGVATLTAAQLAGFSDIRHETDELSFSPSTAFSLMLAGAGAVNFSTKVATAVNLTVYASSAGNTFTGHAGVDIFIGSSGNDVFNGLGGSDNLSGGGGNDKYYVDSASDQVNEAVGGGSDTIYALTSYALQTGQEVELLIGYAGSTDLTLTGNEFANAFQSGLGNDTMAGLGGNDTYYVNNAGDIVNEAVGGGADTVKASVSWAMQAGQEIEALKANAGSSGLTLTGNELANAFVSGAGNDTMVGLGGNDTYYVNNAGDIVTEAVGGGTDAVRASVNWTMQAGQEIERVYADAGATGLTLTGNELGNAFTSGAGNDTMNGKGGNDVYYVNNAGDVIIELYQGGSDYVSTSVSYALGNAEVETLAANAGTTALTLTGNGYANTLVSGAGADTLIGLGGNDRYFVNYALDKVMEATGGGADAVYTTVSYTLAAGQEIEVLSANTTADGITLTGNEFNNSLVSGKGVNTLAGGGGYDTYYINNSADVINEGIGNGGGAVRASVDYTLGSGQEIYSVTSNAGATGLTLTGNEFGTTFFSGAGNDTFAGMGGNDTYYVNSPLDVVQEAVGGGYDSIYAASDYTLGANQEIELLASNSPHAGVTLTGNERDNFIQGAAGDRLVGGLGLDSLIGNNATFVFNAVNESTVARPDEILTFATGNKIDVHAIDADGNSANGDTAFILDALGDNSFATGHIRQTIVQTGSTYTMHLDFNVDGDSDSEMSITVDNRPFAQSALHISDFIL